MVVDFTCSYMVFTVYCLYCNVSGLVVLSLNEFDLI